MFSAGVLTRRLPVQREKERSASEPGPVNRLMWVCESQEMLLTPKTRPTQGTPRSLAAVARPSADRNVRPPFAPSGPPRERRSLAAVARPSSLETTFFPPPVHSEQRLAPHPVFRTPPTSRSHPSANHAAPATRPNPLRACVAHPSCVSPRSDFATPAPARKRRSQTPPCPAPHHHKK
jgi:hypothetical protein